MKLAPRIAAVVVAYRPDQRVMAEALNVTAPQVENILIIANDGGQWSCPFPANVILLKQDRNLGLGAAYNLAVRWARDRGATHLLLLDQDSVPAAKMVAELMTVFASHSRTAAVGPLWRDNRTGEPGFFLRTNKWGARRYRPVVGEIVPVDFLISSGSLIALDALRDVGPFDEELFIDHVDTDWAFRARAKGYQLYGVSDASLEHRFGEDTVPILGRRHHFFRYPPARNYYRLRNSIALWRRPYVPWQWILRNVLSTIVMSLYYAAYVPPRFQRLKLMLRAVRDGLEMSRGLRVNIEELQKWLEAEKESR